MRQQLKARPLKRAKEKQLRARPPKKVRKPHHQKMPKLLLQKRQLLRLKLLKKLQQLRQLQNKFINKELMCIMYILFPQHHSTSWRQLVHLEGETQHSAASGGDTTTSTPWLVS